MTVARQQPKKQKGKHKGKAPEKQSRFSAADWPLPAIEIQMPIRQHQWQTFPDTAALIDIAIWEKRHDEVVRWYEESCQDRWGSNRADSVADAVQKSHPDVSLGIWRKQAESLIAQVKPAAYQEAARYLKKMNAVHVRTKRKAEYDTYIASLRIQHKAKRRLMQVLDALEGQRIVDS